jgi:protein phosphatase
MQAVASQQKHHTSERATTGDHNEVSQVRAIAPIDAAGATHPGRLRERNEDRFGIMLDLGLCVVADGLGGHAAGDIAAQLAIDEAAKYLRDSDPDPTPPVGDPEDTAPRLTIGFLSLAVQHANKAIHLAARINPAREGMGATIAAVLVTGRFAFLAHVGDSRVYRLRAGMLERLTEDHSAAEEYLRQAGPSADPAVAQRRAHLLTRCLGTRADVRVSMRFERFEPGDLYLLCTDGLWGVVEHETIARTMTEAQDMQSAADRLIDLANEAGGPDNITAILLRPSGASADEQA